MISIKDKIRKKHKKLKKLIDSNKHAPEQGTKQWLLGKLLTFGGSEIAQLIGKSPYGDVKKLIASKIGLIPFRGNLFTRWGKIFEAITEEYTNMVLGCNLQFTGSLPGLVNEQKYSPDGLAVVDMMDTEKITSEGRELEYLKFMRKIYIILFEFKAPFSKIPLGYIPEHYVPQVKTGLSIISIAKKAIFINNMYRKCSIEQFKYSFVYDTEFHYMDNKKTGEEKKAVDKIVKDDAPIGMGFVYFEIINFKEFCRKIGIIYKDPEISKSKSKPKYESKSKPKSENYESDDSFSDDSYSEVEINETDGKEKVNKRKINKTKSDSTSSDDNLSDKDSSDDDIMMTMTDDETDEEIDIKEKNIKSSKKPKIKKLDMSTHKNSNLKSDNSSDLLEMYSLHTLKETQLKETQLKETQLKETQLKETQLKETKNIFNLKKIVDLGKSQKKTIDLIFEMVDDKILKVHYSDILIFKDNLNNIKFINQQNSGICDLIEKEEKNTQIKQFLIKEQARIAENMYISVLPWKLLKSDIIEQERDEKFQDIVLPLINKYSPIIRDILECEMSEDGYPKKYKELTYEKKLKNFRKYFPDVGDSTDKEISWVLKGL